MRGTKDQDPEGDYEFNHQKRRALGISATGLSSLWDGAKQMAIPWSDAGRSHVLLRWVCRRHWLYLSGNRRVEYDRSIQRRRPSVKEGNRFMGKCDTCGNDYTESFQVTLNGKIHSFDCFACAIQLLAPACSRCGCVIIGHGIAQDGDFYCSNHCVRQAKDRTNASTEVGDGSKVAAGPS